MKSEEMTPQKSPVKKRSQEEREIENERKENEDRDAEVRRITDMPTEEGRGGGRRRGREREGRGSSENRPGTLVGLPPYNEGRSGDVKGEGRGREGKGQD